ncbi:sugar transferase [Chitinilyticum piscinae]|uniref:Sugar transferase n=1 Tax=Chitinilyticum piscinae TaxID=2866724 RepID=A0A8J7FHI1_9NEIS|nr:sugar transferase [Chitinilyticum piscinae]MBE9609543.1 sugar transferase [Chitinilyticum piscinae]
MNARVDLAELRRLERYYSQPWRRRVRVAFLRTELSLRRKGAALVRRGWDCTAALSALLLFWPLWLALALAIRMGDGGPILYWQQRVGYRGRVFAFPKFRSMVMNAETLQGKLANQHADARTFKQRHDPRITRIGAFMRRFSLDEIPQLWCVLRGDMTLVGPRPPLPKEVARYGLDARQRLEITPGLTCLWQVGGRSELDFEQQLALDLQYIRERSLTLDVLILLRTVPAVLGGRGAY